MLPPIVVTALGGAKRYVRRSSDVDHLKPIAPWSPGYHDRKEHLLLAYLSEPDLLNRFRDRRPLPGGYGVGLDERCVEYPWLAATLPAGPARVLDAGSTLNYDYVLSHPACREKSVSILTLAPEENCFWRRGVGYVFHDVRDIPFRDEFFDVVVCASTLEHVGFDNALYAPSVQAAHAGDYRSAMREMRRVLKPGGMLLLTVPFGRRMEFHEFQQFDRDRLASAIEAFGGATRCQQVFYRYSETGWQLSDPEDCADCEYVEWITRRGPDRPDPLPVEPDLAAAARAVACVSLTKS